MKTKIAIIGSRDLACRITSWIVEQNNVELIGIVPPPFKGWWDDKLRIIAGQFQIPLFDDLDTLLHYKPDLVFSINYWKKVNKQQLYLVKRGYVNIHHSYLLKYRGRYSTSWAIMNARRQNCWIHGTTLHYISEGLDDGPIIDSYKCDISEEDTAESLFNKVEVIALEMFKNNFERIINGQVSEFLSPDPLFFYFDKDSNQNLKIDIQEVSLTELYDIVRAWSFKGRPKPYFEFEGRKIYLSLHNE